jgi:hypothetical protein
MTEENVRMCGLAGFDVRTLGPFEVYSLAGQITGDSRVQEPAHSYTVPFPQEITDALKGMSLSSVLSSKDTPQSFKDLAYEKLAASVTSFDCYVKALKAMSKGELKQLRSRLKL